MCLKYSGMILAAGFGKRMLPLTKYKPKPLIEINGITLLENTINFLIKLGCKEIIINTHYKHKEIINFIKLKHFKVNIKIIYEKIILDTGGAIKNAIPLFSNKHVLVVNSDIYWLNHNLKDVNSLINSYNKNFDNHILLSTKKNSFGIHKSDGDFVIKNSLIHRFKKGDKVFFYSGLQIINIESLNFLKENKFSFNAVWDNLIHKEKLFGLLMRSKWYHVGDIHGLKIARKLHT